MKSCRAASTGRSFQRPTSRRCGTARSRLRVVASATALPQQFKKVSPLGERVFVKVDASDVKSAGGLMLPTTAQTAPTQGEIAAVSEGCSLKKGQRVVYGKYAGTDISLSGDPHVLLKEDDVVGTLSGTEIADLQPLADRVLVKVSESEDVTSAGVLLTSGAAEKPIFGTVVRVGPGKTVENKKTPPNVTVGSTILYSKYSGTEFQGSDETEYIVIRETDVLAELS